MKTILLSFFLALQVTAVACSGITKSFCLVCTTRPGHLVLFGVITSKTIHAVGFKVIDVLTGTETRSAVTIWDGTDYDCNGFVSMKAGDMGKVGDTLIAILPLISAPQNTWDVTGDYRRPLTLFETAWISVSRDTVRGYIFNTPGYASKVSYPVFKEYWQSHAFQCVTLGIKENSVEKVTVIVNDGRINLSSNSPDVLSVTLYSIDGRTVLFSLLNQQQELNCSNLPPGIYLLVVGQKAETPLIRKVIL